MNVGEPTTLSANRALIASMLLVFALSASGSVATAQNTTGISGVVRDQTGTLVEGVRVCALDTASCSMTDAQGAFGMTDIRSGSYRLEIIPPEGLPFTSDAIDVRAGFNSTVNVTLPRLEALTQSITVTAPAFRAPDEVKNSGFIVEPQQILKSAGATKDISR